MKGQYKVCAWFKSQKMLQDFISIHLFQKCTGRAVLAAGHYMQVVRVQTEKDGSSKLLWYSERLYMYFYQHSKKRMKKKIVDCYELSMINVFRKKNV